MYLKKFLLLIVFICFISIVVGNSAGCENKTKNTDAYINNKEYTGNSNSNDFTLKSNYNNEDDTKSQEIDNANGVPSNFIAPIDPIPDNGMVITNISTAEQLEKIGGEQSTGGYYVLDNDINLTEEWIPIDDFRGTLDGQGHSINNLYILGSSGIEYGGLFGIISNSNMLGGTLCNIGINIGTLGLTATKCAGGLLGYFDSSSSEPIYISIDNCYVTGQVSVSSSSNAAYAGGLLGYSYNTSSSGNASITILNCYATSDISTSFVSDANSVSCAGGLIGFNFSAMSSPGPLKIENCYATGNVTVNSGDEAYAGGLIGNNNSFYSNVINNCYAIGNVSATAKGSYVGGLVGRYFTSGTGAKITNCYSTGNVSAISASSFVSVGGLLGYINSLFVGKIENYYRLSTQTITGANINEIGDPLSDEQMKKIESFKNWDFDTIWKISSNINNGYPHLLIRPTSTPVYSMPDI